MHQSWLFCLTIPLVMLVSDQGTAPRVYQNTSSRSIFLLCWINAIFPKNVTLSTKLNNLAVCLNITFFICENVPSFNFLSSSTNFIFVLTRGLCMNMFIAVSPITWASNRSVFVLSVGAIPVDKLISSIYEKGFTETEVTRLFREFFICSELHAIRWYCTRISLVLLSITEKWIFVVE